MHTIRIHIARALIWISVASDVLAQRIRPTPIISDDAFEAAMRDGGGQ